MKYTITIDHESHTTICYYDRCLDVLSYVRCSKCIIFLRVNPLLLVFVKMVFFFQIKDIKKVILDGLK